MPITTGDIATLEAQAHGALLKLYSHHQAWLHKAYPLTDTGNTTRKLKGLIKLLELHDAESRNLEMVLHMALVRLRFAKRERELLASCAEAAATTQTPNPPSTLKRAG